MIMVKAHAKINVALNIDENKLANGYHNIDSIMLPLELHDRIEFEFLPAYFDTMITCDDVSIPTDESNLIVKAFNVMKERFGFKQSFRIHVHKIIPISAGLGGGSADAAAVINTLIKMLKLKVSEEELIEIAKKVGSDVPYCLFNKPSRCKGIGEKLEPISIKNKYHVLLIKPKTGMSTAEAYKKYDEIEEKEFSNIEVLIEALKKGDEEKIASEMKNGLEKPTMNEIVQVREIKEQLIKDGFKMVMMSGSGSTVFAMSKSLKELQKEAQKFENKGHYIKITNIL